LSAPETISGLPAHSALALIGEATRFVQRALDGSVLSWGDADTPGLPPLIAPKTPQLLTVLVSPVRPGHSVVVEYRSNGGPIREAIGLPVLSAGSVNGRLFRTMLPGQAPGEVEFLPVLRFAGGSISPRLADTIAPPAYRVGPAATAPAEPPTPLIDTAGQPRWDWDTKFLGALTAMVSQETVGPTPDGLRIDWHVTEGKFVGPHFEAVVLPHATDWMRIRRDGVAIVSVQACFETLAGSRIYGSYGGIFDLGPDGYARALRNDFDQLPPVVVTPTYATADKQLEWLNRAQCVGVGRVDMVAKRVEFDVYLIQVGGHKPTS
jgi:Protein of unknown function (DUF3237)